MTDDQIDKKYNTHGEKCLQQAYLDARNKSTTRFPHKCHTHTSQRSAYEQRGLTPPPWGKE